MFHLVLIIGKGKVIKCAIFFAVVLLMLMHMVVSGDADGYVVFIIDDLGNWGEGTEALFKLDVPITVAVMPFSRTAREEAALAEESGFEVLMHVPMEPEKGRPEWLGDHGITTDLSDAEIAERIRLGLRRIEVAVGMNNHMGSEATRDERVMRAVLRVAVQEGLFFVDSKTTPDSVVADVAEQSGVPHLQRDVFLDNQRDQTHIEQQILTLADIALQRGYAVGVGHVGPEGGSVTIRAIEAMIPRLQQRGVEIVPASFVLRTGRQ